MENASLILFGNLNEKLEYTFANSVKGACLQYEKNKKIDKVVILDTHETAQSKGDRDSVIRDILGRTVRVESVPCEENIRTQAFSVLAELIRLYGKNNIIVDVTNGQRKQTFDLIVAAAISKIENVVFTNVPRECFTKRYIDLSIDDLITERIEPFTSDHQLEEAAQFELIYYSEIIDSLVYRLKDSKRTRLATASTFIGNSLKNAVLNYFSSNKGNLENALRRLGELHEAIAKAFDYDLGGDGKEKRFVDHINSIKDNVSKPARIISGALDSKSLLVEGVMLDEIFTLCRHYRNYLSHPSHRKIEKHEVRLVLSATFSILEKVLAVPAVEGC